MYQNEPNKLVLILSSLVFNINLDVYIVDGCLNKTKDHNASFSKTRFAASSVNELPVISLFYFMSNYYKVYTKPFCEKNNFYLLRYLGNDNEPKVEIGVKQFCEKCNSETKMVYLKKYSLMACSECVRRYIDNLIEQRAEAFFNEDYNNRECNTYIYLFVF